ncbi:hypothetical protein C1I98_10985 [Spongiactinospora gelatinilytica]|uniref:DUF7666 domain-containing protein n=1 Tax=Spongiactinospora gelatinilytica TaxID=2666298 RepID=A0A2W2GQ00_9ACTN|nr:hypothetical protein [Spongiactinospora gelatinilytica]PZG49833.1 hypothetical protein C1I98_10985 [Spongiactinospora gelatinilytica]
MQYVEIVSQAEYSVAPEDADLHVFEGYIKIAPGDRRLLTVSGSAHVAAGNTPVIACGHATVEARRGQVTAYDQVTVIAYNSRVTAYGDTVVRAYGSSEVTAGTNVTAYRCDREATVRGGKVIEIPLVRHDDIRQWCEHYGVKVADDDTIVLYKGVRASFYSGWGMHYPLGGIVTAPDWSTYPDCGGGLHLSPSPAHVREYVELWQPGMRILACRVELADGIVHLGDKVKVRRCMVLHEVDTLGRFRVVA